MKGKTVGIDATTLEANAALRSIVRLDTSESSQDFLTLAQASGIETPTRADVARIDRKRKEERLGRRVDASARSRREDHKDEEELPDAVPPLRPHRQSYADLFRTLGDGVGGHRVEVDATEHERAHRKDGEQIPSTRWLQRDAP